MSLHALTKCQESTCIKRDNIFETLYDTCRRNSGLHPNGELGYIWKQQGDWSAPHIEQYTPEHIHTHSSNAKITYYKPYPQETPDNEHLYASYEFFHDWDADDANSTICVYIGDGYIYKTHYDANMQYNYDGLYHNGDLIAANIYSPPNTTTTAFNIDLPIREVVVRYDSNIHRLCVNNLCVDATLNEFTIGFGTEQLGNGDSATLGGFQFNNEICMGHPIYNAVCRMCDNGTMPIGVSVSLTNALHPVDGTYIVKNNRQILTTPFLVQNDYHYSTYVPYFVERAYGSQTWSWGTGPCLFGYLGDAPAPTYLPDVEIGITNNDGVYSETDLCTGWTDTMTMCFPGGYFARRLIQQPTVSFITVSPKITTDNGPLNVTIAYLSHYASSINEIICQFNYLHKESGLYEWQSYGWANCGCEPFEGTLYNRSDSIVCNGTALALFNYTWSHLIGFTERNYTVTYEPENERCRISGPREFYIFGQKFTRTEDEYFPFVLDSEDRSRLHNRLAYYDIHGNLHSTTMELGASEVILPIAYNTSVCGTQLTTTPSHFISWRCRARYESFPTSLARIEAWLVPPSSNGFYTNDVRWETLKFQFVPTTSNEAHCGLVINNNYYDIKNQSINLPHATGDFSLYYTDDAVLTLSDDINAWREYEPVASGTVRYEIKYVNDTYGVAHQRWDTRPSGYRFNSSEFYYDYRKSPKGFEHLPDAELTIGDDGVFTIKATGAFFRIGMPNFNNDFALVDRYTDSFRIKSFPENSGDWYFYYYTNLYKDTLVALREEITPNHQSGIYYLPVAKVTYNYPDEFTLEDTRYEIQEDPRYAAPSGIYGILSFETDCKFEILDAEEKVRISPKRGRYFVYINGRKIEKTESEEVSYPPGFWPNQERATSVTYDESISLPNMGNTTRSFYQSVRMRPRDEYEPDEGTYMVDFIKTFMIGFDNDGKFMTAPVMRDDFVILGKSYASEWDDFDDPEHPEFRVFRDASIIVLSGVLLCSMRKEWELSLRNLMKATPEVTVDCTNLDLELNNLWDIGINNYVRDVYQFYHISNKDTRCSIKSLHG